MNAQHLVVSLLVTLLAGPVVLAGGTTWHVDENGPNDPGPFDTTVSDPLEDGSADHPFDAIQEGIDAASNGDTVLVADGLYRGVGNRDLDYGGRLITVRGASGNAEACVIDGEDNGRGFHFRTGETSQARLESIGITNGKPPGFGGLGGGGILIEDASPVIIDCDIRDNECGSIRKGAGVLVQGGAPILFECTIRENAANFDGSGAGIACVNAQAVLIDCVIRSNFTVDSAGSRGGGVYMSGGTLTMTGCTVRNNSALIGCCSVGGGIYNGDGEGTLVLDRCIIQSNTVGSGTCAGTDCSAGGGIYGPVTATNTLFVSNSTSGSESDGQWARGGAIHGSGTLVNCVFLGNRANHSTFGGEGGALYGTFTVTNCTFAGNEATGPGANGSAIRGGAIVSNSIFWTNGVNVLTGGFTVVNSRVEEDPGFVEDPDPGADGFWGTEDDLGDLRLSPGSPSIDAGDNTAVDVMLTEDFDGLPRFLDDPGSPGAGTPDCSRPLIDLGAFEFQGATPRPEDLDGSGVVAIDDIVAVVLKWGVCPGCPEDLDGNGVVDIDDLVLVVLAFDCTATSCAPDCNGNDVPDGQDIWTCTSPDCDANGVPDECELAGADCNDDGVLDACDPGVDCNGNSIPDECDLAAGGDCDGDGILDECDPGTDCDGNGVPDVCDIAAGGDCDDNGVPDICEPDADCNADGVVDVCQLDGNDCNDNGVLDPCDIGGAFMASSGAMGPIGGGASVSWTIPTPPVANGDVTVFVESTADLDAVDEKLSVILNGVLFVGVIFGNDGGHCSVPPDSALLTISAASYNATVTGGPATFLVTAPSTVATAECPGSSVTVTVEFEAFGESADENGNGIPDECEP